MSKDLPALHTHSAAPFTFALLKGRSNYLCRAKLRAADSPDALFEQPVGVGFPQQLDRLRTFASRSETGDRAELDDDISHATWAAVSCTSGETHSLVRYQGLEQRSRTAPWDFCAVRHGLGLASVSFQRVLARRSNFKTMFFFRRCFCLYTRFEQV